MIRRLCSIDMAKELKYMFQPDVIVRNVASGSYGIDVSRITYLMEEAAKMELKQQLTKQLEDINRNISNTESLLLPTGDMDETISKINEQIQLLQNNISKLSGDIESLTASLNDNERQRNAVSKIKNINIEELSKRSRRLEELIRNLEQSENEYNTTLAQCNEMNNRLIVLKNDLKRLEEAHTQYDSTAVLRLINIFPAIRYIKPLLMRHHQQRDYLLLQLEKRLNQHCI